ncbi:MAG: hypothetical protein IK066_12680 [Kiritimatiellae bacterium]|nr:hypothetical protein [Kiritimatiellia bacterium]
MASALERLVAAAEYPEGVPTGARSFTLQVDGGEVYAEESGGRIRLARRLTDDASEWPALAACAPGRMLREEATPAVGPVPGNRDGKAACFLWQDAPADTDAHGLRRLLETFLDSCDWWRARTAAGRQAGEAEGIPALAETIIRP